MFSLAFSGDCLIVFLQGHVVLVRGLMHLELEPVSALAPLGPALVDPHPVDVGVALVAETAHHAVAVHGVDDVGLLLGPLAALRHLQEEGVLRGGAEKKKSAQFCV